MADSERTSLCQSEAPEYRLEVQEHDRGIVIVLSGIIDFSAATRLHAEALRLTTATGPLSIDWRQSSHISAGALQVLLALGVALSIRGQQLQVIGNNPGIHGLIELAGMSHRFPQSEASMGAERV